ncbi:hypothetical protein ACFL21_02880 [Patescibacteria group bacterium]
MYFIENFELQTCNYITQAPANDPLFFLSIFISPIYLFFRGIQAYYAILILHSLIISSLVFPLYKIFKKFKIKDVKIALFIPVILFLPHIIVYEKMAATEPLFFVLNIWMLYFYLESFFQKKKKDKAKFKITAFVFALLASAVRPYGFITFLSLMINEIVISKKKKNVLLILVPIFLLIFSYVIFYHIAFFGALYHRIFDLTDPQKLILVLKALKNQLNSYIVTTALIPFLVFFGFIFSKKLKAISKIRWFLLTIILLNFLISANHIYGYLAKNIELHLIERYINLTSILIIIFGFIFLEKEKKYILNIKNIIITGLCVISLFFLKYTMTKHALNMGLSIFFDTSTFMSKNRPPSTTLLAYYYIPILFGLFVLLISNKRQILIYLISLCFLIYSGSLFLWEVKFSAKSQKDNLFNYFRDSELNILYIFNYTKKTIPYSFWRYQALTNLSIDTKFINNLADNHKSIDFNNQRAKKYLENYDYIISAIDIPGLTPLSIISNEKAYKLHND